MNTQKSGWAVTPWLLWLVTSLACGAGTATNPAPTQTTAAPDAPTAAFAALVFDCLGDSPDCPEVAIAGDPPAMLPNGAPSPTRGYGDPALRADAETGRLWLLYSSIGVHVAAADGGPMIDPSISTHLAYSDDNGVSWTFERPVWPSQAETYPASAAPEGYSIHEVSTLAPFGAEAAQGWYAAHLRYWLPRGGGMPGRRADSMHLRLTSAPTATGLGDGPEIALGGPLTAPGWESALSLSTLHPDLNGCDLWTEPALFAQDAQLYLLAQCIAFDKTADPWRRTPAAEFIGLFAAEGGGDVQALDWRWVGKLTDAADAAALDADVLTQADLAPARDGALLLILTPKTLDPDRHHGCRVLEVSALDPPALARDESGALRVRADIRASDSADAPHGQGLCTYAPESETGVLIVRVEEDPSVPEVVWRMHATGVHP
ncbi:MAG: sialidase family protein [Anaerolineales bacterium]